MCAVAAVRIILLAAAVLGVFIRPARIPNWVVPAVAAVTLLLIGGMAGDKAVDAVRPLVSPLAFLLLAVPLAAMLDRLGFFSSVAALVDTGPNPRLGLWVLAAAVTTFLNLDASVVLLTPLYIRIARRHGFNPTMLAMQPVLLACLASSALPISNLTNLIAADRYDLGVADFVSRLGPASLVAVVVGWYGYRRIDTATALHDQVRDPVDPRALRLGTPIVVFVVLGFTVGDLFGVPAWAVALVADVVLFALTRTVRVSDLPFGAAALAVSLGVVATAASPELGLGALFSGSDWLAQVRVAGLGILGANTINNLPALLIGLPEIDANPDQLWPLLFGVNFGPVLVLHGALAGLLWRATAARLDVHVSPWQYTVLGVRIGLPALVAGLVVVVATGTFLG
ncbi:MULTISPECIES: SLC13 family permease [Frankiaceae]|uniref:Citrate transporter n=1 Tax=Candidatus Protofrankia datiscae TaxID=2716812 RepID=F8B6H7_9ACTN|nr:Citrate transporter [Candidatus Protofrankia datiscae]